MKQHDASRRSFLKATAVAGAAAATGGPVWAQAAGDKPLVTLRMSSTLPLDPNSAHFVWYDRFSKNLQATVGNKVVVNYFPSDQLGKEADVVQQVKIGGVDMMISGSSIWATLVPEIGVLDMGYLFTDNDHCGRALDGKAGAILNKMVDERINVQVLGWCYSLGARNVWTKNPVKTASDLKGVKLRVLPVPNFIATLRYMGAVPTPLPFGEIYTALQTGVVDGFEHDAPTCLAGKFYEVAKNCALTQHIYNPQMPVISNRSFARIPADLQKPFLAAATEASLYQRTQAAAIEQKAFAQLKTLGLTTYTVDRAQLKRDVSSKLWGEFTTQYPATKPVVDEIEATK
jgi:tripartite ATP-independent transporter DctP family solute receptor